LAKSANGRAQLTSAFNLCTPLEAGDAAATHLLLWARNAFVSLAMGDYPYATGFLGALPANPVNVACAGMLNATATSTSNGAVVGDEQLLAGLAAATHLYYGGGGGKIGGGGSGGGGKCANTTREFVFCADQTGCGEGSDGTSWDWQACTEITCKCCRAFLFILQRVCY
jgi:dipeptidyl-peptidase-2